jgi:hypothetical protein
MGFRGIHEVKIISKRKARIGWKVKGIKRQTTIDEACV